MTPEALRYETHEEWLELRTKGVGGSDAAAVVGLNPYRTPLDVYFEKRGETEPEDLSDNEAVHFGNVLEDVIAQEYSRRTGRKVRRNNRLLRHPEHSFMQASLDREVVGESRLLECKTAGAFMADQWGEAGTDEVPMQYLIQCMHYLAVTGKDLCDLAVLIGGRDFRIYPIQRDEELVANLIAGEAEFWRRVQDGDPPPPQVVGDVHKLHPRDDGSVIRAETEAVLLVEAMNETKGQIKQLEAVKREHEKQLKAYLGDHAILEAPDGRKLATWKNQTSSRFDAKAFKADHPDIDAQYRRESEARVLRTY